MNWTLHEDGIVRKTGQSACFLPTEAEKEFWARIQELEDSLTFWKTEARNLDAAISKAEERNKELQQTLNKVAEIAKKALNSLQTPPLNLPHTNQDQIPPQNQEPRLLD